MSMTKKQKRREWLASMCDQIAGGRSQSGVKLRARNRAVEKRKRRQCTIEAVRAASKGRGNG